MFFKQIQGHIDVRDENISVCCTGNVLLFCKLLNYIELYLRILII